MSALTRPRAAGVLRPGWQREVHDYATGLAWSADGATVIVGDAAGSVHGFDARSGEPRWVHAHDHEGGVHALTAHRHLDLVVTGGADGRTVVRSIASGAAIADHDSGGAWVEHLAWAPRSATVAAAAGRHVDVIDLADPAHGQAGKRPWRSPAHASTVGAVAWAGDDQIAVAGFGAVRFWQPWSDDAGSAFEWTGSLISLTLSPDGEIVACGSQDNTVHFWRRSTGKDASMYGYPAKPAALAFDERGRFLATGGGADVTVWRFDDGGPEGTAPATLSAHAAPVSCLAFSHRGATLASGGRDGGVIVWRLGVDGSGDATGFEVRDGRIEAVAWRPDDGALAAIDATGMVTTWRIGR